MSGTAAKSIRRDIRRAFGAPAFDEIATKHADVTRLDAELREERARISDVLTQVQHVYRTIDEAVEPLRRGFIGRLRWLVRGR